MRAACAIGRGCTAAPLTALLGAPDAVVWLRAAAGRGAIRPLPDAAAGKWAAPPCWPPVCRAIARPPAGRQLDGGAPPACRAVAAIAAIGSACL